VDPDAYFAFGLDLLLAGIEMMAVRKRSKDEVAAETNSRG
jgi:hypothetical protein